MISLSQKRVNEAAALARTLLNEGDKVQFEVKEGDKGLQADLVTKI